MAQENDYKHLVPAVLVAGMDSLYLLFSWLFIQCPLGCQELNGKLISVVAENKNANINKANERLNPVPTPTPSPSPMPSPSLTSSPVNANVNLSEVKTQVDKLKEDADKLPLSNLIKNIDKLKKEVGEPNKDVKESEAAKTANANTAKTPKKTIISANNTNTAAEEKTPEEKAADWCSEGDFVKLLTDEKSIVDEIDEQTSRQLGLENRNLPLSLLNSQRMYLKLLTAFDRKGDEYIKRLEVLHK